MKNHLFFLCLLFILCLILMGCNDKHKQEFVDINTLTKASFSYTTNSDKTVNFTNTSKNASSYTWDFGDGNSSTETNPIHQYNYGCRTFNVKLIAVGNETSDNLQQIFIDEPLPYRLRQDGTAPVQSRTGGVHFSTEGKGYIGLGDFQGYFNNIISFNPSTGHWGGYSLGEIGLSGGTWFIIDGIAYMGMGYNVYNGLGENHNFFSFNLTNGDVNIIEELFPLLEDSLVFGIHRPLGFSHNGKGYVMADYEGNPHGKIIYEFDPITKSWTDIGNFPFEATSNMMHFIIDGKLFVGLGNISSPTSSFLANDFWEYDIETNSWIQKNDFPIVNPKTTSISFSRNGKGYFMLDRGREMWEYSPIQDTWELIEIFPCGIKANSGGFLIENTFYFFQTTGREEEMKFFKYTF